ncbi:unnamed protein product [Caenorhabditis bovis]|uniref:Uncharacterized protein n=1 Tax=Caenorhabditis bovis TaxID=2654633 RepID=A0A8S1FCW9_9PELO|nr:unnamed protein product [Caenorhabditis bovis]
MFCNYGQLVAKHQAITDKMYEQITKLSRKEMVRYKINLTIQKYAAIYSLERNPRRTLGDDFYDEISKIINEDMPGYRYSKNDILANLSLFRSVEDAIVDKPHLAKECRRIRVMMDLTDYYLESTTNSRESQMSRFQAEEYDADDESETDQEDE